MAEIGRLVVTTPWFPTPTAPYAGTFVAGWLSALGHPAELTTVIHVETVAPEAQPAVERRTEPFGTVVRIQVPASPTAPRPVVARAQLAALRTHAAQELAAADVVHAHVGMPTGWAVASAIPDGTRLVLTEHASYLPRVLHHAESRRLYAELVARSERVLTVSEATARMLRAEFPKHRKKVRTVGNPISAELFPPREALPHKLRHWLYVGNLLTSKGVDRVIRSFAAYRSEVYPDATLTLVGQGSGEPEMRALAAKLGVADVVEFAGGHPHEELHTWFAAADVLVHLSRVETFGLTVIEAAIGGLPVVVTTCGGPQETLADAAADGLVRFVPVGDDVESVVAAVEGLETALATSNVTSVRETLVERYGAEGFSEKVRAALAGEPDPEPNPDAPVVVAIGFSTKAIGRLVTLADAVIRAGGRPVLVTDQEGESVQADPRARVVDLSKRRTADPVRLLERISERLTRAPLAAAEAVLTPLGLRGGSLGARADRMLGAVARAESFRLKVFRAVHRRILSRFYYGWIDPYLVGRAAIRHHLDEIASDGVDLVVQGDDTALPLAWRLARLYPDAQVTGAIAGATLHQMVLDVGATHAAR